MLKKNNNLTEKNNNGEDVETKEVKIIEDRDIDSIMLKHVLETEKPKLFKTSILTADDHAKIIPFGDIHYGHKSCDYNMLNVVLKWLYNTPNAYIIGMGDYLESSIIDSPGLFDQKMFLDDQLADVIDLFRPLAEEGRIIGLLDGNHEHRVKKQTGLDITKLMCKMLKVQYLEVGALHLISVRTNGTRDCQKYTMYTTHGASGAIQPQSKIIACMNLSRIADAEIFAMGHLHSLYHQKVERYTINEHSNSVIKRSIHYILTGSYLNYWSTYSHMKSMLPSGDSGSPKINLHCGEHRITVSL
jgi:predicted phosphodiesterase